MKVKDILKIACDFIGFEELKSSFEEDEIPVERKNVVDKLVSCFNLVQEEIATEFVNLSQKEKVDASQKLEYYKLSKTILAVVGVKDKQGNRIPYRVFPDHVSFKGEIGEITYTYIPDEVTLRDDIVYLVPARVYAYAIAREYFLFEGLVDKATMFENRFKNSIEALQKKRLSGIMPPVGSRI